MHPASASNYILRVALQFSNLPKTEEIIADKEKNVNQITVSGGIKGCFNGFTFNRSMQKNNQNPVQNSESQFMFVSQWVRV